MLVGRQWAPSRPPAEPDGRRAGAESPRRRPARRSGLGRAMAAERPAQEKLTFYQTLTAPLRRGSRRRPRPSAAHARKAASRAEARAAPSRAGAERPAPRAGDAPRRRTSPRAAGGPRVPPPGQPDAPARASTGRSRSAPSRTAARPRASGGRSPPPGSTPTSSRLPAPDGQTQLPGARRHLQDARKRPPGSPSGSAQERSLTAFVTPK